jgi:hypothetical protein
MKSQAVSIIVWALALFLPILIFILIGNNLNERQPLLPFIVCPLLLILAARFTNKLNLSLLAWSAIVGLVYAVILVFAV